jgi:hypothetical protein
MRKLNLIISRKFSPMQIGDFPVDCVRSRDGAVYLRPGSTLEVTSGEWDCIKAKLGPLSDLISVIEAPLATVEVASKKEEPFMSSLVIAGDDMKMTEDGIVDVKDELEPSIPQNEPTSTKPLKNKKRKDKKKVPDVAEE